MGSPSEALRVWNTVVPSEWIDYNGHMTEGYYGVAFGAASDELLFHLGFTAAYREVHGTFYSVENHTRYLLEVAEGSTLSTATLVLGADEKRIHVHHDLLVSDDPEPVATQECMMLHVAADGDGRPRAAAMSEPMLGAAMSLAADHSGVPLPGHVGRGLRILR